MPSLVLASLVAAFPGGDGQAKDQPPTPVRVLLVTGVDHPVHHWKETAPALERLLVTTPPRERGGFLEQPPLQLFPVAGLLAPPAPSGPAASAGGSSSERSRRVLGVEPRFPPGWSPVRSCGRTTSTRLYPQRPGFQGPFVSFNMQGPAIPPSPERDGPLAGNLWSTRGASCSARPAISTASRCSTIPCESNGPAQTYKLKPSGLSAHAPLCKPDISVNYLEQAIRSARTNSGLVPQQPPRNDAPASISAGTWLANVSAVMV